MSYENLENKLQEVRKKRESEDFIMEGKNKSCCTPEDKSCCTPENKSCYTPEEVRLLLFDGQVSLTTVRQAIHKGQIPSMRLGEGTRSKILIPGSYVREMMNKGYCRGE